MVIMMMLVIFPYVKDAIMMIDDKVIIPKIMGAMVGTATEVIVDESFY